MLRIQLVVCAAAAFLLSSTAFAQISYRRPDPRLRAEPDAATQPTRQPQHNGELYRLGAGRYVYPEPYRPDYWSPQFRPLPDYSRYSRSRLRRHGIFPRYHHDLYPRRSHYSGYGYGGYGYGGSYGALPYGGDVGAAYDQGRYDADHEYIWYIASQRAGLLINQNRELFNEALILMRAGRYDRAVINLLGAAEKDHGDAASRLHAGHALFALGRYEDATDLIARAFELSPGLTYRDYDIRDEYGDRADFDRHLAALKKFAGGHPKNAGAVTLLGYVTYYTTGPGSAHVFLEQAARLNPNSYFIPKLLKVARLTRSAAPSPEAKREPSRGGASPASGSVRGARI